MSSSSSIYVVWAQHAKGCRSWFVKAFTDKSLAVFTNQTVGTFANNPFMSKIKSGSAEFSLELEKDVKYVWVVMWMMLDEELAIGAFVEEHEAVDYIEKFGTLRKSTTFSINQTEVIRSLLV